MLRNQIKGVKMKNKPIIVGIVALYKPKETELKNIRGYIDKLDYCFLLDDSGFNNSLLFEEIIKEFDGKVEYVLNEKNLGLCASVNRGFKLAEKREADWVLVMNPDGTFQNDAIGIFRDFILKNETSNIAIVAPRFNIDRRQKDAGIGYKFIHYADMTGCLYNTEILNKLGYYDAKTYFYCLDLEYCLRVAKAKYRIVECCEAVLNHNPAETYEVKLFGKTLLKVGKDVPVRYYYQFRSGTYIHKKYHSLRNFGWMAYKLMKVMLFFDNKSEYLKMVRIGIKDARRGFFGNICER